MSASQRELPDGRVELVDRGTIEASPLYNEDLAPVPVAQRNWTTYNYAALWISMAHCIPTYMLASGLMAQGMSWKQALFTILLGKKKTALEIRDFLTGEFEPVPLQDVMAVLRAREAAGQIKLVPKPVDKSPVRKKE